MESCLILIKKDFDNLENHNPCTEEIIGIFTDSNGLTAQGQAAKWMASNPPVKQYLGYDKKVYPQYILKPITVLNQK